MTAAAGVALAELGKHLHRSRLAPATERAYSRAGAAYTSWLGEHHADHEDAFTDVIGAEGAVTAWRRHLLGERAAPASINQGLAAITLLYQLAGLRITVTRARVPRPGEPDALTAAEQGRLERAADRRGCRDAALIAVLLHTGPRVEEAARLDLADVALTARTGTVRFLGKGEQPRTVPIAGPARERLTDWLDVRGRGPGSLWLGQRGPLSASGITQAVLAVGEDARLPGLRPHRLRHTYATRLRQSGADPAHIQALLGHSSLETAARYFRAGAAEIADVVERAFGDARPLPAPGRRPAGRPRPDDGIRELQEHLPDHQLAAAAPIPEPSREDEPATSTTQPGHRNDAPDPGHPAAADRVQVTGSLFAPHLLEGALWVGRPAPHLPGSRYANAHKVGKHCARCDVVHDQAGAVLAYTLDLAGDPALVAAARAELPGRALACRCALTPGVITCHADVLRLVAAGADPAVISAALTRGDGPGVTDQ